MSESESKCKRDCSECGQSCVAYPTILHENGRPFCKLGRPVVVHRLCGYSMERGDMTPGKKVRKP